MKTLIAVDGSDFTPRVLDWLARHRQMLGATPDVTLLVSVPTIPPHAARYVGCEVLQQYYDEEAERILGPARDALSRAGIAAQSIACRGHPATVIAEHATSGGYDLVVMGSHGHSALGNVVLGSVATAVLAQCPTPVLLVR